MIADREIWAVALHVQKQHGDRAPMFIAERIGALALAGDEDGMRCGKLFRAMGFVTGGPQ